MSLHTRLLELLGTPASRGASDTDVRRSVERLLVLDGSALQEALQKCMPEGYKLGYAYGCASPWDWRGAGSASHVFSDPHECVRSAWEHTTAPSDRSPVLCPECKDQEAQAWRRRIELDLGDGKEVRGATHTRLRRMLSLTLKELGADLATAQRERDEALTALAELRAQHVHALDVIALELDAGDLDTLRLRLADYREVARG